MAAGRGSRVAEVLVTFLVTLLLIRLIVALGAGVLWDLPLALVPILFMWGPVWVLRWRGADPDHYPLALPSFADGAVWRRDIGLGLVVSVLITLPFLGLYHLWQVHLFPEVLRWVCSWGLIEACRAALLQPWPAWRWPPEPWLLVAYHLFFVAVPEELFYRGYMQSRLDEVWPPRWRIAGATLGPGWLLTCVIFALGHSLVVFQWWHLAIVAPSLIFGWMRARTGGIIAGAVFHAWCNILVAHLDVIYGIVPS